MKKTPWHLRTMFLLVAVFLMGCNESPLSIFDRQDTLPSAPGRPRSIHLTHAGIFAENAEDKEDAALVVAESIPSAETGVTWVLHPKNHVRLLTVAADGKQFAVAGDTTESALIVIFVDAYSGDGHNVLKKSTRYGPSFWAVFK